MVIPVILDLKVVQEVLEHLDIQDIQESLVGVVFQDLVVFLV